MRGPKKKKGGPGEGALQSTDIVNIWKTRQDPKIHASDMYPAYLMQLLKPQYSHDDIMWQLYRGERMPDAKEQWSLAKSMKRTFMVDSNTMTKRDWEYESDDDVGENLGDAVQAEDYEGELESGEAAAKEATKVEAPPKEKKE